MLSEKLIALLKNFSKYELNRLKKFISSPYFNDQEDVLRLFELLHQVLKKNEQELEQLSKAKVWEKLYPRRVYDDTHFRRLSSDLTQLILRFMVEEFRNDNNRAELLDLQKLLEKPELKKHLTSVERNLEQQFAAETSLSAEYYLDYFHMNWNIFDRASKGFSGINYTATLTTTDQYLDYFYAVKKLKIYASWLSFSTFRITKETHELPPGFWEALEASGADKLPMVLVYKQVITCLADQEDESHFQALLEALEAYGHHLAKYDLRECFQFAQNYCALKINQGKPSYYREIFRIIQNLIERNLLLEDDQLSEGVFKNVITASSRVGEFEWAERFIDTYAPFLPAPLRENARTFNLANLYSHQKKHDKVIELLRNVEYSDVVYALSSKVILVRTYYETDEFMALDSLIDSFKIYLLRNKFITKSVKTEYNNFLGFVKKISTMPPHQPALATQLRIKIERCTSVASKKWLLEKMDEL
jgi:hypothetical protein